MSTNKYITSPDITNENVEFNRKLFLTIAKLELLMRLDKMLSLYCHKIPDIFVDRRNP